MTPERAAPQNPASVIQNINFLNFHFHGDSEPLKTGVINFPVIDETIFYSLALLKYK